MYNSNKMILPKGRGKKGESFTGNVSRCLRLKVFNLTTQETHRFPAVTRIYKTLPLGFVYLMITKM